MSCKKQYLFIASAILSSIATICFVIGASGHADEKDIIRDIPWGKGDRTNRHLGLQGAVGSIFDGYEKRRYSSEDCTYEFCSTCETYGDIVVTFCILGLLFAAATAAVSTMLAVTRGSKITSVCCSVCGLFATVFSIMAVLFFLPCLDDTEDVIRNDMYLGVDAQLTIVGFVLMFLTTTLVILNDCIGAGGCFGEAEEGEAKLRSNDQL
jgi:hypothetical protein